jgi:hypothetical protein
MIHEGRNKSQKQQQQQKQQLRQNIQKMRENSPSPTLSSPFPQKYPPSASSFSLFNVHLLLVHFLCILAIFPSAFGQWSSHSHQYWPNNNGGGGGRWMGGPKSPREIILTVVKNISEDTPIGEILLNFRAEDKGASAFNLT